MAVLSILKAPDIRLNQISKKIELVDDNIRKFMKDMLDTMYHDEGIGLAAPQVGVLKRILVLDLSVLDQEKYPVEFKDFPIFMANPKIKILSDEKIKNIEGCLSLPDINIKVERSSLIQVEYLDYNNTTQTLIAKDLFAVAIQHEIDHLDGKLLIDYLSPLKKNITVRQLLKMNSKTK